MRQRLLWLLDQADAIIALGIAVVVGILGLLQVTSAALTSNAVLVTLGVLAVSVLRDRTHRSGADTAFRDALDEFAQGQRAAADLAAVKVLRDSAISDAHAQARRQTDRWLFRGGTGTYIRAVTLPELVRTARLERRAITISLEILDPADASACERYARFRRSVSEEPDGTGESWDTRRVHAESYATVLAACFQQERFGLLNIQVGLCHSMSTFRFDLSSSGIIITQDDARLPALFIPRSSFLYDSYDTEIRTSIEQAHRLPLEKARSVPLSDPPEPEEVIALFAALGLPFVLPTDEIPRIIEKALHAPNPYA